MDGEEIRAFDIPMVMLELVIFDDEVGKKLVQHLVHENPPLCAEADEAARKILYTL